MLPVTNPTVIYRSLPDGAVLFSTVDEVYFGLNAVAARIWELLPPATRTFDELCTALEAQYPDANPDSLRDDARTLLEELEKAGLAVSPVAEKSDVAETAPADR